MLQILWFEVAVKAISGAALFVMPVTLIGIFGLARGDTGFWPRACGALLIGIAAAVFIGLEYPQAHGAIGPAGLIAVNLASAAGLIGHLVMGSAAPARRGRVIILLTVILLLALAFAEIAGI